MSIISKILRQKYSKLSSIILWITTIHSQHKVRTSNQASMHIYKRIHSKHRYPKICDIKYHNVLKPQNAPNRCLFASEKQTRKRFFYHIVTGDDDIIITPSADNHGSRKTAMSTPWPNIHGSKTMLCVWWDQLGIIHYVILKWSETIAGKRNIQLMRMSFKRKTPTV